MICHLKDEHRLGRNHLKGREGDRINVILAAAGYKLRPAAPLAGRAFACLDLFHARTRPAPHLLNQAQRKFITDDL